MSIQTRISHTQHTQLNFTAAIENGEKFKICIESSCNITSIGLVVDNMCKYCISAHVFCATLERNPPFVHISRSNEQTPTREYIRRVRRLKMREKSRD